MTGSSWEPTSPYQHPLQKYVPEYVISPMSTVAAHRRM